MHGAVIVIRERRAGMAGRLLPDADHFDREASPAYYLAVSTLATSGSVAALVSTGHRAPVACLVEPG